MLLKRRLELHFSIKKGAILLLIGLLVASVGGYVATSPPTFSTTQPVNQTAYSTQLTHSAVTIENDSVLYENGTILHNQSVYYTEIHPNLVINPKTSLKPKSEEITSKMYATRGRQNTIIWQQQIDTSQGMMNLNQQNQIVANISNIQSEMAERQDELPQGSVLRYEVLYTAQYTYEGETFNQTATSTIIFDSQQTYAVETNSTNTTKSASKVITNPVPAQTITIADYTLSLYGTIGIGIGLLIAAFGLYLIYGKKFDERTYEERLYQFHLDKYKDWITFGRPLTDPQLRETENKVLVNSLEGLVQISIDSDGRVVYSEDLKRFYIFINDNIYFFNPPKQVSPLELNQSIPSVSNFDEEEEEEAFDDAVWQQFDE